MKTIKHLLCCAIAASALISTGVHAASWKDALSSAASVSMAMVKPSFLSFAAHKGHAVDALHLRQLLDGDRSRPPPLPAAQIRAKHSSREEVSSEGEGNAAR